MPATSSVPGATELLPPPDAGRTFGHRATVRLGDVDVRGRLRLDATARMLQDIATADADDAGLDGRFGWVVRRTLIVVDRSARLDETLEVCTYCTGTGRSWAERTTVLSGSDGASIRTVSLWVQVDAATGRPTALTPQFHEIYDEACAGRKVSPRLSLAVPDTAADATVRPWAVRRVDLDPFDHVNNAANWAFVEEAANLGGDGVSRRGTAELEFVAPVTYDDRVVLYDTRIRAATDAGSAPAGDAEVTGTSGATELWAWLTVDGEVRSVSRLRG